MTLTEAFHLPFAKVSAAAKAPKLVWGTATEALASLKANSSTYIKQVLETHAPDGSLLDVKPILQVTENIVHLAAPPIVHVLTGAAKSKAFSEDGSSSATSDVVLDAPEYIVNDLACKMSCKSEDVRATTLELFKTLSSYSWEAKVVLTVAAFAVNYAEFALFALLYNNPLAQSIAVLKQLPKLTKDTTKSKFDEITKLVTLVVDVTKSIVEFSDLPHEVFVSDEASVLDAKAYIPTAAYWAVQSVVVSASVIARFQGIRRSTKESWDLASLVAEGTKIQENLLGHLKNCKEFIENKKNSKGYFWNLVNIFNLHHSDNLDILLNLLSAKDGSQHLIYGTTKIEIKIQDLAKKNVLFLVSGLDLTFEEIEILEKSYLRWQTDPKLRDYVILWLPVVGESWQHEKFTQLQSKMPWYTVQDPSLIRPEVIKFITKKWYTDRKTVLVPLDHKGKVLSLNALDMLLIWGHSAFPFTVDREKSLWEGQKKWTMEFLLGGIDEFRLLDWSEKGKKTVCFYGGGDANWLKGFKTAIEAASEVGLELVYIGSKHKPLKNITSDILPQSRTPTASWYFWTRLETILSSKLRHGKTPENDEILREVLTLLSFHGSDEGWTLFAKGSSKMVTARGSIALKIVGQFDQWKGEIKAGFDFLIAFSKRIEQLVSTTEKRSHCNHIILPGNCPGIPGDLSCVICSASMKKYVVYKCCDD